jgi:branched-subunit amino acid aminotransferase/4-amino-4-deoxychorismate lyase
MEKVIISFFKDEVATPECSDLILPGVTRDSVLQLLRLKNR